MVTHTSILAWGIPSTRGAWQVTSVPFRLQKEVDTTGDHLFLSLGFWVEISLERVVFNSNQLESQNVV